LYERHSVAPQFVVIKKGFGQGDHNRFVCLGLQLLGHTTFTQLAILPTTNYVCLLP